MARSKEKRKVSLKKERARSYKIISNTLIMASRDIILGIAIRNRNKTEKLERKSKFQTKNGNLNRKSIREENEIKPEKTQRKRLFSV
jgi:hypothetical protein